MNPLLILFLFFSYFLLIFLISHFTSKNATSSDFFNANKSSPWYIVAFGMIGTSLSGVTFISVPGEVGNSSFSYFQIVLGYLLGYFVIATILMPLYYKLNLVSIYTYLDKRFGFFSYKTGSFFFLLSRIIGSSFRLFLVASVLQIIFFDSLNIPFFISVFITISLIWVYTYKGGIKTIVWTDTLQTFFMLSAVIITILLIMNEMDLNFSKAKDIIISSSYSDVFVFDWKNERFFLKQFFSGAFIAIVMTGLDQDMMQKNLTCKNLNEAQKNIFWFCIVLLFANILFLTLGALLHLYADFIEMPLPSRTDNLYPLIAINHLSIFGSIVFLLGIIAAAYSSADSALTSLTTAFCIDFLNFEKRNDIQKKSLRLKVHFFFSVIIFFVIQIFSLINDESVINAIFKAAGYTYGPLLGLFSFGILTNYNIIDRYSPIICFASPILSFIINIYSESLFFGYRFGFEILLLNGLITFVGLFLISLKENNSIKNEKLK